MSWGIPAVLCGTLGYAVATQDGSGEIARTHDMWASKQCECGGPFLLVTSCVQYYDGSGTHHDDIPDYFNSQSADYFDALMKSKKHDKASVRERAERQLAKYFPDGKRPSGRSHGARQ